jgi:hypothetical protein
MRWHEGYFNRHLLGNLPGIRPFLNPGTILNTMASVTP